MSRKSSRIRLGVNIDHGATLRQVRGGTTPYPDLLNLARLAVKSGAEQITVHLREDRRHIQDADVTRLCRARPALINLEMAVTREMLKIALREKPDWVCLVPEKRQELTTEGGLDLIRAEKELAVMIPKLQAIGIEVSLFIDADPAQVKMAAILGAEAIELHTGSWCEAVQAASHGEAVRTNGGSAVRKRSGKAAQKARGNSTAARLQGGPAARLTDGPAKRAWQRLVRAAEIGDSLGLGVHAGHGLDYETARLIRRLPFLREVNIGHSLICYALEEGLGSSVKRMRRILDGRVR